MSDYHSVQTGGMWGGGVRNAAERHIRAAIAAGRPSVGCWVEGDGDTATGRVLFVWRAADLATVVTKLAGEGRSVSLRDATAEELLAAGGHELRGAMGERGVSSARVMVLA